MNSYQISITPDQAHAIVVGELTEHYDTLRKEVVELLKAEASGTIKSHKLQDLRNNERTLNGIERVLQFYLSEDEYEAWIAPYEDDEADVYEPMTIAVTGVTEHDDGSATYDFDMSDEAVLAFAKIGLQHAIIEAAEKILNGKIAEEDAGRGDHDGGEREGVQATRAPA